MMLPFQILATWLKGLLALAFLILGPYFLYRWYHEAQITRTPAASQRAAAQPYRSFEPHLGANEETLYLALGLAMTLYALPKPSLRRLLRKKGPDEPRHTRAPEQLSIPGENGESLHIEMEGPKDAPPLLLTHGWSLDSTIWFYLRKHLSSRFRLIAWDLPGLGLSAAPADKNFSLDRLAKNLDRVIAATSPNRPVALLGHSIGGMILLTYAKLFPENLGPRVSSLTLVHTTYTNPLRTAKYAALFTLLEKPLITPLLYLTIALSPLVRLMNFLSYLNGSSHSTTERTSLSGNETRGQLDFAASFTPKHPPATLARGMLGMLHYDASYILPQLNIPTLIITADQDPLCSPEAHHHMHHTIPHSQLITLQPGKHLAHFEHHQQFAETLTTFLSTPTASSPVTPTPSTPAHPKTRAPEPPPAPTTTPTPRPTFTRPNP